MSYDYDADQAQKVHERVLQADLVIRKLRGQLKQCQQAKAELLDTIRLMERTIKNQLRATKEIKADRDRLKEEVADLKKLHDNVLDDATHLGVTLRKRRNLWKRVAKRLFRRWLSLISQWHFLEESAIACNRKQDTEITALRQSLKWALGRLDLTGDYAIQVAEDEDEWYRVCRWCKPDPNKIEEWDSSDWHKPDCPYETARKLAEPEGE